MQEQAKEIAAARDYMKMVPFGKHPEPGEYFITGIQAGNLRGERGWHFYVGYVVQVRKKAGAFGSDLVLLRHPDGTLMSHENQSFHRMNGFWTEKAKAIFPAGMTPDEYEDYSQPYTLGEGRYPEIGKVIEPKKDGPPRDERPLMKITMQHADGSQTVEIV